MTQMYSNKYIRMYHNKNKANARKKMTLNADSMAAEDLLGQSGYKATLLRIRYSN